MRAVVIAATVVAVVGLGGCATSAGADAGPRDDTVARVEQIPGTELHSVTLSELGASRLGVETGVVRDAAMRGRLRRVLPASAVIYNPDGATFAFEARAPREFVRIPLTLDFTEGDVAVLSGGPAAGTSVVTVGVSELYGTETGVDGE